VGGCREALLASLAARSLGRSGDDPSLGSTRSPGRVNSLTQESADPSGMRPIPGCGYRCKPSSTTIRVLLQGQVGVWVRVGCPGRSIAIRFRRRPSGRGGRSCSKRIGRGAAYIAPMPTIAKLILTGCAARNSSVARGGGGLARSRVCGGRWSSNSQLQK